MKIGILALQGSVEEHKNSLEKLGIENILVKKAKDLDIIDGLILPGGESTTFVHILKNMEIFEYLKEKIKKGLPVLSTCAGLIILAKRIENHPDQNSLNILDITVSRNAYGRQRESFITYLSIPILGDEPFEAVFIRAPKIVKVGEKVKVHAVFQENPVFIEEENVLGLTFHPELTNDLRVHKYFLSKIG
ncbi:MAG: pyridoxal 5'-phosphate synthase glutaminase subunit PdxT [Dictyoglomus sp.]|nr:pyridoxal 5'-phosphate synthase glutaminase subunit PdxT [Dictyoglomus sp.]MDW8188748.1 pyridoxal 5'-phosphate synthase glutaminase subunit PdxT [Dictyoglomus sp.]